MMNVFAGRHAVHRLGIGAALIVLYAAATALGAASAHPVYEPSDGSLFDGAANLFLEAAVSSSPHWNDRAATFAVDGDHANPANHWAAENIPVTLTVDLGEAKGLNAIRLWTYWGGGRYYQYRVEGSLDTQSWIPLADMQTNTMPADAAGRTFIFPTQTLRYVRTTFTHNSVDDKSGGHIVEIEGYALSDDAVAKVQAWDTVPAGLHASVASVDVRYPRNVVPDVSGSQEWSGVAWRGERLHAQLVLWSADGAEQVRTATTPLRNEQGHTLPPGSLQTRFVRYVLGDGQLQPDILDTAHRLAIPARSVRPIWGTIDIPAETPPGVYRGKVTVKTAGQAAIPFVFSVEVLPLVLPPPAEWAFHLDLWQNPWAVARYHHVEPWSEAHWQLLEPLLTMLANAGQKCITTSLIHQPWGGQTYDAFSSMIEWRRRSDGSWAYDYSLFDRYVEFAQRCGITKQINCYSMVPWTNRFHYTDEATGEDRFIEALPGTPEFAAHWRPFLRDFAEHLRQRGWLDHTLIAMDERPLEPMQATIALVKEVAPELKIALAGNYHKEIKFDIHDLSIIIDPPTDPALLTERVERGLPTTFYVCCVPPRPNTFLNSPPAESAWLGWYTAAHGYTGLLRWAYNSWTADPFDDTSHSAWRAADCFVVYPNARSSIRFERLREGIQDFEKIRRLRGFLVANETDAAKAMLADLDAALEPFTYAAGKERPCADAVNAGKRTLEDLSRKVAATQAKAPTQNR
ncbi:MAG: DUF4091 domain-containing protein [Phycisphaerae bacterium]|nr:DUF4091 domain-containing protein [Phycisphaerae bacterium]